MTTPRCGRLKKDVVNPTFIYEELMFQTVLLFRGRDSPAQQALPGEYSDGDDRKIAGNASVVINAMKNAPCR